MRVRAGHGGLGCLHLRGPPRHAPGQRVRGALEVLSDIPVARLGDGRSSILSAGTILVADRVRGSDGALLFCGAARDGGEEGFTCLVRDGDNWRAGAHDLRNGPLLRPAPGALRPTRA